MNERIKELAQKCWDRRLDGLHFDQEKFAELIVEALRPPAQIPTMKDAIAAGDGVLMGEQAALLRECRAALDSLISQKPTLAGLVCGSTTLGNLRASMYNYRPQGIFGVNHD